MKLIKDKGFKNVHQITGPKERHDREEKKQKGPPDVVDGDDPPFTDFRHPDPNPALIGEAFPVFRDEPDEQEPYLKVF